jgi:hypothetical protein
MYRKKSHGGVRFVLAVCLAMVVGGASARPAQADGSQCNYFGAVTTVSVSGGPISVSKEIRPNRMCFDVYGDRNYIHNMEADFYLNVNPLFPLSPQLEPICIWRIDWVIYYNGKTWWRDNGPPHGCSHFTGSRIRGAGWAPNFSEFCAELYYVPQNTKIADACVNITP